MKYLAPRGETVTEFTLSRSRFITYLVPIEGLEDAAGYQKLIRKRHGDATHVCYAALTPSGQKAFDDGEPGGTAGAPMLNVLKQKNLWAAAVTVRYFGGIKLGAGGLTAAYGKGVNDTVAAAALDEKTESAVFTVTVGFTNYGAVKNVVKHCKTLKETFTDIVTLVCAAPTEDYDNLQKTLVEVTFGNVTVTQNEIKYEIYPLGGRV